MGKVANVITKIMFVAMLASIGVFAYFISTTTFETDGSIKLLDKATQSYYIPIDATTCKTNINGMSNVYFNMQNSGYRIYNQELSGDYIDVSFVKSGNDSLRYYYNKVTHIMKIFSSDYENSWLGESYINSNKERAEQ